MWINFWIICLVSEGRLEVTKDGEVLGEMNGGTVFGELAILYNCKRTATVKGTEQTILFYNANGSGVSQCFALGKSCD